MVPHSLNSAYSDGSSQILWEDSERVFHRGWRLGDDGKRCAVLLVAPAADHPFRSTLDHFSHEYELKDELDSTWAVLPLELVREANRTMLVLDDAGGEPLEHRIADKRILRLIAKWLKVGTVEDGRRTRGVCGAPQGAVISPILANVYLHYVFDLWVHRWRLTKASGDMIVIRYADDTIVGFQHEHEARAFLDDLKERMRKFELALHPDKTRLIRFGRHAAKQREKLGEGKPETFDFLGFTHFCTRSRKWGTFVIGRKTIKKRMRAKLLAIKIELRRIMHDPIAKTGAWVKQMLKGHLNYFAVSGQPPEPVVVLQQGEAALARVAQAAQPNGTPQLGEVPPVRRPLLSANQNDTPAALSPLRRQNPREEPGALAAHAGICTGCGWQRPSLP